MKKIKDLKKGDIVYTWDLFSEIKEYTVLQLCVCMSDESRYRLTLKDDSNNIYNLTAQGDADIIVDALSHTLYTDKEKLLNRQSEMIQIVKNSRTRLITTVPSSRTIAAEAQRRYPDCGEHGRGTGDYEYPEDHSIEREVFMEAAEWAIQKNIEDSIRWFRLQQEEIGLSWREDFEIRYREAMLKTL